MTWQVWRHRFRSSFTVWRSMQPAASHTEPSNFWGSWKSCSVSSARVLSVMGYFVQQSTLACCRLSMGFTSIILTRSEIRRVRLGIKSALAVIDTLDFKALKEYLIVTDRNLASHIKALDKERFIGVDES